MRASLSGVGTKTTAKVGNKGVGPRSRFEETMSVGGGHDLYIDILYRCLENQVGSGGVS